MTVGADTFAALLSAASYSEQAGDRLKVLTPGGGAWGQA